VSRQVNHLAVEPVGGPVEPVAQAHGAAYDGIEDRLHIGRRARDHPENLARRRLLLERLGQLRIAGLQLLEQAHVLDGNYRLVGEGLQQSDLRLAERLRFQPPDGDRADRLAAEQHRHGQRAPVLDAERYGPVVVGVFEHIRYVDHRPIEDRPAGRGRPARAKGEQLFHRLHPFGPDVLIGGQVHQLAVVPPDHAVGATAQPHGFAGDGVENRLDVGGRARDHAQDLAGGGLLLERLGEAAVGIG